MVGLLIILDEIELFVVDQIFEGHYGRVGRLTVKQALIVRVVRAEAFELLGEIFRLGWLGVLVGRDFNHAIAAK